MIGVLESDDIKAYYNFLDTFYINLGSPIINELFYDGFSSFKGFYLRIYVWGSDKESLYTVQTTALF